MRRKRKFSNELRYHVAEELLSGLSTPDRITKKYKISSGLLYYWKKEYQLYLKKLYSDASNREAAMQERLYQLEQLVGQLTRENEFLKQKHQEASQARKKTSVSYQQPTSASLQQVMSPHYPSDQKEILLQVKKRRCALNK